MLDPSPQLYATVVIKFPGIALGLKGREFIPPVTSLGVKNGTADESLEPSFTESAVVNAQSIEQTETMANRPNGCENFTPSQQFSTSFSAINSSSVQTSEELQNLEGEMNDFTAALEQQSQRLTDLENKNQYLRYEVCQLKELRVTGLLQPEFESIWNTALM